LHRAALDGSVGETVEFLAIVHKPDADNWLARHGEFE
jgi:hypothetical protein